MKNTMLIIIVACVVCAGAVVLFMGYSGALNTNGGGSGDAPESDATDVKTGKGISYELEDDGAELNLVDASVDKFYGTWVANSDLAKQTYGNVEITIEAGGTWTGIITDEPLEGKWQTAEDGIALTSTLFDCKLAFSGNGTLVMIEDTGEEYADDLVTVLIRK